MRSSRSAPDPLGPSWLGFAHRGLHGAGVPENSLSSFQGALKLGAGIECDVRLSGDGEVMVFHDSDLGRLTGTSGNIETLPAREIAGRLLMGGKDNIPWLGELLDLVRGQVPILVEAKTCRSNAIRLAEGIAEELDDYAGPVGVMSFDPKIGWWFARHRPYVRRGLVVDDRAGRFERWTAIGYSSPHFIAAQRTLLGTGWASRIRQKKYLYSWTVRTSGERAQASVHADALIWEGDGRP